MRHCTMVEKRKKNTDKIAIQSFTVPRARERTDERVAQYLHLDFGLFWPTVCREGEREEKEKKSQKANEATVKSRHIGFQVTD